MYAFSLITSCQFRTDLLVDDAFYTHLKALSPAALDLSLRQLVTIDQHRLFLHALTQRLRAHRDFEAVQAIMTVFLRVHGDVIVANADGELGAALEELVEVQRSESRRVSELLGRALGTLGFVRDVV